MAKSSAIGVKSIPLGHKNGNFLLSGAINGSVELVKNLTIGLKGSGLTQDRIALAITKISRKPKTIFKI